MIATRDEATSAVLGAVMLSDTALDTLLDERLRPPHFHLPTERRVFEAMLKLRDAGEPIDPLTLKARLEPSVGPGHPWRDQSAMRATVDLLAGATPAVGNVRAYCAIVRTEARFEQAGHQLTVAGEALQRRDWDGLVSTLGQVGTADAPDAAVDASSEFMDWYEHAGGGVPLPFEQLTEAVGGGLQPGEVTVIGGWTGMRKTFLLAQILRHAAGEGARCHEYANEMFGPFRTARTLSALTGVPQRAIRRRELTREQWGQVLETLNALPYETTATAGWAPEDYARELRRHRWDLAAIDTATNLPCRDVAEWDRACVLLADAAAQAGTHLILVCQLNLSRDQGHEQPPPTSRDLRNTGAWSQRARVVMFVHADQEPLVEGQRMRKVLNDGHIRIDKATHGDLSDGRGFLEVTFNPRWLRFEPLDDYQARAAA